MTTQFSLNYKIHNNQTGAILLVTICSFVLIKFITPLNSGMKSIDFWRHLIFDLIWCVVLILFVLKQIILIGKLVEITEEELRDIEVSIGIYGFQLFDNDKSRKVFRKYLDGKINSYQDLTIEKQFEDCDSKTGYSFTLNSYTFVDVCLFTHHFSDLKLLNLIFSEAQETAELLEVDTEKLIV